MTDFSEVLNQAKKIQEKMKETQEALKKIEVQGISGGNSVKIYLNGDGELKKIDIDPSLMTESKEILEDLIVAAHNDAKQKLKKKTNDEISKITGGLNGRNSYRVFTRGLSSLSNIKVHEINMTRKYAKYKRREWG